MRRVSPIIALLSLSAFAFPCQAAGSDEPADVIKVSFVCDAKKTVRAVFINTAPSRVQLVLSDGRRLTLNQTKSGSGARYANRDESIVFWNKGDGAFVEERGQRTHDNCVVRR